MWNHRDLEDPLQKKLNQLSKRISDHYGTREKTKARNRKKWIIHNVIHLDAVIQHSQTIEECSIAWKSHATWKDRLKISLT